MVLKVLDLRETSSFGGINSQLVRILPGLRDDKSVCMKFGYLAGSSTEWLLRKTNKLDVNLIDFDYKGPFDIGIIFRLSNYINLNYIDIVHTHGYKGNFISRLILDLHLSRFSTIITKHGTLGTKELKVRFYGQLDHRPTRLADQVVAVDDCTEKRLLKWGVNKYKIERIDNPAPITFKTISDKQRAFIKEELGIPKDRKLLLYMGRFTKQKGIFDLLRVQEKLISRNRSVFLVFVGGGEESESLRNYVTKLQLEKNIKIFSPQLDVEKFYNIADMLILPSYSEGAPNVVLEAFAAKVPVIASNVGGIPSIVSTNHSGLLITPGNIDEIVRAVERILQEESLAERLIKNASDSLDFYSPMKIGKQYLDLYKGLINNE